MGGVGVCALKFLKGLLVLAAQMALSLATCSALTLLIWIGGPWYAVAAWFGMPLFGLFLAHIAVRLGVNNYLAWMAPPLGVFFAHYIVTGYTPDRVGPTLLTALLSVVGAAAGLVVKQSKDNKGPGGHANGH
jgi:hypothetical protein